MLSRQAISRWHMHGSGTHPKSIAAPHNTVFGMGSCCPEKHLLLWAKGQSKKKNDAKSIWSKFRLSIGLKCWHLWSLFSSYSGQIAPSSASRIKSEVSYWFHFFFRLKHFRAWILLYSLSSTMRADSSVPLCDVESRGSTYRTLFCKQSGWTGRKNPVANIFFFLLSV